MRAWGWRQAPRRDVGRTNRVLGAYTDESSTTSDSSLIDSHYPHPFQPTSELKIE
jgi:hypothetical protein